MKKKSMKRPGPYSVLNSGRQFVKLAAPPPDPLRDHISEVVRDAVSAAMPDLRETAEAVNAGVPVATSLITGLMQCAAEITGSAPAYVRNFERDQAVKFYLRAVSLDVGAWHKRNLNRVRPVPKPKKSAEEIRDEILKASGDEFEQLAPVLRRYIDTLRDTIGEAVRTEDPKGSALMMLYALMEVSADALSGIPDAELQTELRNNLMEMFKTRIARKTELKKEPHEPDAADGQLQADPLETVPAKDDGDL